MLRNHYGEKILQVAGCIRRNTAYIDLTFSIDIIQKKYIQTYRDAQLIFALKIIALNIITTIIDFGLPQLPINGKKF